MKSVRELAKAIIPDKFLPPVRKIYWLYRPIIRRWYQPLQYYGNNVLCPMCGRTFRKFMPFDFTGEPNAQCPRCWSLDRYRLIYLYMKEKTNIFTQELRVLHFAPEYCFERVFKRLPNIDYLSADLGLPLAMANFDITDVPYEDETFDVIFCNHVLEHVIDDRKAMRELYRVLKRDGWTIIQVPINHDFENTFEDESVISPEDRERIFGQFDHVRVYGKDYPKRLEQAGFKVKVDDYLSELDPEVIKKYELSRGAKIHFCTKR